MRTAIDVSWGTHPCVSELAIEALLEAYANLTSLGGGLLQQLACHDDLLRGLLVAVRQGSVKAEASAVFVLSQVALSGPEAATEMAFLPGLTEACTAALQRHARSHESMTHTGIARFELSKVVIQVDVGLADEADHSSGMVGACVAHVRK